MRPVDVIAWLLDSDPAIRWQVLADLADAPEDLVAAERARVAGEGWGARLLALQQPGGQWPVGTPAFSSQFGHAQLIELRDEVLWGASDPRALAGAAAGW